MTFCAIFLLGLLSNCGGLGQLNWSYLPPTLSAGCSNTTTSLQNNTTIPTSQINLSSKLIIKNDEIKNQSNQLLSPPKSILKENDLSIVKQVLSIGHVTDKVNDTIRVPINEPAITDGEKLSMKNWGLSDQIPEEPGEPGMAGADRVTAAEVPLLQWHVGVYSKAFQPYMQICGGTLVTTKAVISAAHCFWNDLDGLLPASNFVIAAGKLYRPWTDNHDLHAQKSEVSSVHLPARFRGAITSFQDDIAAVLLATKLTHSPALRPLCVLFDEDLEYTHLQSGNEGIVLGWGLTAENGPPAQALQYLYMPYVPIEECIASTEPNFVKYITSDKICAGVTTGKALCRGDSGGGLVFLDHSATNGPVPLLFGVASTAPRNEHLCNTHARATLTRILAHRAFLRAHIPDIEEACAKNYDDYVGNIETNLLGDRMAATQESKPAKTKLICNCHCNNSTKT